MALISPVSWITARDRGYKYWELILSNWGNRGLLGSPMTQWEDGQDPNSVVYPSVKLGQSLVPMPGFAGIAISPNSEVDRAYIIQDTGEAPISDDELNRGVYSDPAYPSALLVSTDAPLYYPVTSGVANNLRIVTDPSEWFNDVCVPAATDTTVPFGTAMNFASPDVFVTPTLRLIMFFRDPPLSATARSPYSYRGYIPAQSKLAVNPYSFDKVLPAMGRKHVRVRLQARGRSAGQKVDINLCSVKNYLDITPSGSWVPPSSPLCTEYLIAALTLVVDQTTELLFEDPKVDFLAFRVRYYPALGPSPPRPNVHYSVEVSD